MARPIRFPIAGLMGAVLVIALCLAALRNASDVWAGVTLLLTCGVLCLAIVGIVCGGEVSRAWWLGFALFGWGYLLLAFWASVELPTMALLDWIGARLGVAVQFKGGMGGGMTNVPFNGLSAGGFGGSAAPDGTLQQIAHCLWALLAALVGGVLAHILFGGSRKKELSQPRDTDATVTAETARRLRLWPAVIGTAGCVLIVFLGLLASRSAPEFWAGAAFLIACGLIGMTVLGAVFNQGVRRQRWLGAALFGVGYMTLTFGFSLNRETWPKLPTDHLLYALRPWFPGATHVFPSSWDGVAGANARIRQALEQPVPLRFPNETPLEDILKFIRAATKGKDGKGIPIYVDPIGMMEAEKTLTSTAIVDLDDVALKTSLRLCLKQLDLSYSIRDGLLMITSEESAYTPVDQDPFLIVGHCLLALLAAGLGGLLAPFVSERRSAPATQVAAGQPTPGTSVTPQAGT